MKNMFKNTLIQVCELILETIVNKNPCDVEGLTPLHLAAQNGHIEIYKLIAKDLHNKNPKDREGKFHNMGNILYYWKSN